MTERNEFAYEVVERSSHDAVRQDRSPQFNLERARALICKAKDLGHPLRDDRAGRRAVVKFLKTHNSDDLGNWAYLAKRFIDFANTMWL
jgi:hypothetical protein